MMVPCQCLKKLMIERDKYFGKCEERGSHNIYNEEKLFNKKR